MMEGVSLEGKAQHNKDAEKFLAKNKGQVLGVLEDPAERELVQRFSEDSAEILSADDERRLTDILERFETKIFEHEKPEADPGAKRVLVTSDNPGSWNAVKPLIAALEQDARCKSVIAVVSGVAGKQFEEAYPSFGRVQGEKTVLGDAISLADREPIDAVVASVSDKNGPEDLALFGGKGNLGARKTFFIFEGYGGVGGAFNLGTKDQMEKIDGIFCNDPFAQALVHKLLPDYPTDHIYATGTLAAEGFELDKATEYRAETRAKLGIGTDAFAVLYLGDVSADYAKVPGAHPNINTKTFEETLAGIETFVGAGKRDVALIVRPHPRDPDKEKLVNAGENERLPENLSVKNGSRPFSINEVAYASDVLVSIAGTENFFAPARGRRSIFLAYDGPGFAGDAFRSFYGPELIEAIRQTPGVFIASSSAELAEILERISKEPLPTPVGTSAVVAGVLDKILG